MKATIDRLLKVSVPELVMARRNWAFVVNTIGVACKDAVKMKAMDK